MPNGKLLGTTTSPGTGGEKKAKKELLLYIMDMASKKIEWQEPVFPGVQEYSEMRMMPDGLVYGITDKRKFFVFNPEAMIFTKDIFSNSDPQPQNKVRGYLSWSEE